MKVFFADGILQLKESFSSEPVFQTNIQGIELLTLVAAALPVNKVKRRGPPPSTGRYDTREELVDAINCMYYNDKHSTMSSIGRACRVSSTLVAKILDTKEGYDRWLASRG